MQSPRIQDANPPVRASSPRGLVVRNLRFRGRGPFSFHLPSGTCTGLTGPSGVGKSLLLRALADLDPFDGEVLLSDRPAAAFSGPQWRHRVGYLPATSQWWHETVGEHFRADWESLIAPSGLPADVGQWTVNRLSTGERQRLAILRLLSNRPAVLLLDEPTANLDHDNARRMEALILDDIRQRQAAALWVSHDPALLERVADHGFRWQGDGLAVVGAWRTSAG